MILLGTLHNKVAGRLRMAEWQKTVAQDQSRAKFFVILLSQVFQLSYCLRSLLSATQQVSCVISQILKWTHWDNYSFQYYLYLHYILFVIFHFLSNFYVFYLSLIVIKWHVVTRSFSLNKRTHRKWRSSRNPKDMIKNRLHGKHWSLHALFAR